jgi:hypothetical protein
VAALGPQTEMGFKLINLKRCLALVGLVGIILLMGAILPVKQPPAATSQSPLTIPELTYARMDLPHPVTNSGFLDGITLSFDPPPVTIHDPDLDRTSLNFQRDLPSGSLDKLQPRPGNTTKPALTVADQKLYYEFYGSEGFAFQLNLKPAYPNPEAAVPTGLDPGFGVSLKF